MRFVIAIFALAFMFSFASKVEAHTAWSRQVEEMAQPQQDWRWRPARHTVRHYKHRQIAAHHNAAGVGERRKPPRLSAPPTPKIQGPTEALLEGIGDWFAGLAVPPRPMARTAIISTSGNLARARLPDGQIIVVASRFADRFVGFFTALFQREGRLPGIGCRENGHQRNSLHHWGGACDVGQSARNVAWRAMYHVTALAERFGLEDGCTWHRDPRGPDCGHIQVPQSYNRIYGDGSRRRYAFVHHRRYHQHRYAGA